jgi:hypothetical protein
MESIATRLVTIHSDRRNGEAVNAVSENVAPGAGVNDKEGEECSETSSANGAPRHSNRGRNNRAAELGDEGDTGVPAPANRLAASADKLNMIRAVK